MSTVGDVDAGERDVAGVGDGDVPGDGAGGALGERGSRLRHGQRRVD